MNDFTASNGISVARGNDGTVSFGMTEVLYAPEADALREFFRAEEDARLGRWRWPKNRDYVVYPKPGRIAQVFCEWNGYFYAWGEAELKSPDHYGGQARMTATAARAYFDAHPEPKPAWHDAKPGDVWLITSAGGSYVDEPAVFDGETFVFRSLFVGGGVDRATPDAVKDARRIYPEVAS